MFHKQTLFKLMSYFVALVAIFGSASCSDNVILQESLISPASSAYVSSGDIFIVSGGAVASTATPFPLHVITQWSEAGAYIRTVAAAPISTTLYSGASLDVTGANLYYTIDTVDRIDKINLSTLVATTHVLDANLTGTNLRALAVLSDGSVVVAESTTSIERYTAAGVRVTVNFPFTVTASIQQIKRISGGRFVVLFTGNPDNPKVFNNDGTLAATISGLGCTTNCDPNDIVELPDGRFVVSVQTAAFNSLELFSSSFVYIGQLFKNASVLQAPGAMTVMKNGDLLACTTSLNTCERIAINGNTGTRVGTQAFISDASLMRQPTSVVTVP